MLNQMRSFAQTLVAKILFGILVFAFAVWGVGNISTGGNPNVAAYVGSEEISLRQLDASLKRELQQIEKLFGKRISMAEAQKLGVLNRAMESLLSQTLLIEAANKQGITATKDLILSKLREDPAFQDESGNFSAEKFNVLLSNLRVSEQEFVNLIIKDLKREQLADSLFKGITINDVEAKLYYKLLNQKRDASYIEIKPATLAIADPSDEKIQFYYDQHAAKFSSPEWRKFSYVVITHSIVENQLGIDEEALKKSYESNAASFQLPERRDVSQLIFKDQADALEAYKLATEAQKSFADISQEKDVTNTRLSKVTESSMLPNVREVVFNSPVGTVKEPVQTALGWHLLKVTKVHPPEMQKFEDVKADLAHAMKTEKAADLLYDISVKLEDAAASGTDLKEVAKELNLNVKTVDYVNAQGQPKQDQQAFDQAPILAAAYALEVGEASPLQEVGNGEGYFMVQLDDLIPTARIPLASIKDKVTAALKQDLQQSTANQFASELTTKANAGETFTQLVKDAGYTLKVIPGIKRDVESKALGPQAQQMLFSLNKEGETAAVPTKDGITVMQLNAVHFPDIPNNADLIKIKKDLEQFWLSQLYSEYRLALQDDINVDINNAAINRLFDR